MWPLPTTSKRISRLSRIAPTSENWLLLWRENKITTQRCKDLKRDKLSSRHYSRKLGYLNKERTPKSRRLSLHLKLRTERPRKLGGMRRCSKSKKRWKLRSWKGSKRDWSKKRYRLESNLLQKSNLRNQRKELPRSQINFKSHQRMNKKKLLLKNRRGRE